MGSRKSWLGSTALVVSLVMAGCGQTHDTGVRDLMEARIASPRNVAPGRQHYLNYRDEMRQAMERELALFYPAVVDADSGGFIERVPQEWAKLPEEERSKHVVYQARVTWTAAEVARLRPGLRETYLPYARHGFEFLQSKLWDAEQGGFYWTVRQDGALSEANTDKHGYGQAFGIYAAATFYLASGDERAIDLAMKGFEWLEKHAHDQANGGYYETYKRSGERVMDASDSFDPLNPNDVIGTRYGFKSMNTHIHLMEAFTVLAMARPGDERVRQRLDELFHIVRDKMAVAPGCLNLYYTPDWKSPPMYDSFGHNVETSFLLYETDLLRGKGTAEEKTLKVAKMLVDQPLEMGWDKTFGGFYYEGLAFGELLDASKAWWTQAEGLNALLIMHQLYGDKEPKYWQAFCDQWTFIREKQIDAKTGGWFNSVAPAGEVVNAELIGSWKANYHSTRAMLQVMDRLERLAGESAGH